jgi:hypothetical protein
MGVRNMGLTGPEALTHAQQLALIGQALGRPLHFEEISAEVAREAMVRYAPAPVVDAVLEQLAAAVRRPPQLTDTVREITGRLPLTFAKWAEEHAAEFVRAP